MLNLVIGYILGIISVGLAVGLCRCAKRGDEQLGITDDDMADVGDSEIYEHPAQYGHVWPRIWRGEQ